MLHRHPHVTAVCDEVYEKLVYDGRAHTSLCSLPGMWDRCVTVSSVGKTFSCTGWKVCIYICYIYIIVVVCFYSLSLC